jgi:hypothetical protein
MRLFDGLDRAYGIYALDNARSPKGKEQGRARTVIGKVEEVNWLDHLEGRTGIGIVPIRDDGTCTFGCMDIDVYNLDIESLSARSREMNLPLVLCRSKSGGAHMYLFMKTPTPCSVVRKALLDCSIILDFAGCEIFPKQENLASKQDVGNWLNMPYFDAARTTRYAVVDNEALTAEQFLDHAESAAVTHAQLLEIEVPTDNILDEGPPCLQALARNGIPEGTRNEVLFNMGVYTRVRYKDEEGEWEEKLDAFNQQFNHPPLSYKEVASIAKQLSKKEYFYKCTNVPLCNYCNKDLCRTRKYGIGDAGGDDPGIMIDSITEITTEPKIYIVSVNGVRIQMCTEDLTSQTRFARHCIGAIRKWPDPVKPRVWSTLINKLLIDCDVIEAPDDASPSGQLSYLLEQFCTTRAQARTKEELLMGKPWSEEGLTYFRSNDFYNFLKQQKFNDYRMNEVFAIIRDRHTVQSRQFKIKGKCVRCWSVPEFVRQDAPHEAARVPASEF